MLNLVPTLLGPQNADPLAQLRTTLASPQTIQAQVKSGGVAGTLRVAPDGSLLVTTPTQTLVHGREADWEFDREMRLYDRLPPAGPLLGGRVGTARLAEDAAALLVPIFVNRGKDPVLDRTYRREGSKYESTAGSVRVTLTFGKDRKISGVRYIGPQGGAEWSISGFQTVANDPAKFRATVPPGYSEAFEGFVPDSLRIGSDLPKAFRSLAPKGARAWLLAVLERGTEPSDRAAEWLKRLNPKLPTAVLDRATAGDRRALVAPDSPTYILVNAFGKVIGVWVGHDPREEKRMEEEMQDAVDTLGEEAGS